MKIRWMMAAVAALALSLAANGAAQDKANFTLDWVIIGPHTGYYAALDRGFFKEQGIDLTITPGRGSGNTIKMVTLKNADFGLADLGAMIIARSKGGKNRMTAMIIGKTPYVLYSLEPDAVRKPKDLEGKKIGTTSGNTPYVLFPAFAKINNVDPKKVEWVIMERGSMIPSLMAGTVDLSAQYEGSGPIIESTAKKNGKTAVPLLYRDWGFHIYSNGLLTRDEVIAGKPDLVRRFLGAAFKGVVWAMRNEDEAIKILTTKYNQAMNPQAARDGWRITINEMLTDEAKRNGLGYMAAEKVKATRDMMAEFFDIQETIPLEEIYTNEFLPGVKAP